MDSDFVEVLDSQVKKFRSAIMRDYWRFRRGQPSASGFQCFELSTKEYSLLKFFEVRFEEYIRRYLFNGFLGRILEQRGNGVYPTSISEIDANKHYRNIEFEEIVKYEFVIDSIINNKRIGVRYSDFVNDSFQIEKDIDEVYVITWDSIGGANQKAYSELGNGKKVVRSCLREFVNYLGFSTDEYNEFTNTLYGVIMEVQDLLGIKTIPTLNPPMLFRFRFEVEQKLKNHVSQLIAYSKAEDRIRSTAPEILDSFTWAYQIIDDDNKKKYSAIEQQSKDILIKYGALKTYSSKQYYQALIGRSDFAKSFITSEYLYRQYNANDRFDYTAIVSGYLKCIEQLLFQIVCFAKNKNLKIKSTGKKLDEKNKLPYKIDFTKANLEKGWCDITLGSLTYFLNESKTVIISDKKTKGCVFSCLQCFIEECRNDSFHKHNISNWSRVEKIRNNTIILIEILLACCKLGEGQQGIDDELQIVRNDKFERVYYWITSITTESFYVVFQEEEPIHVRMGPSSEYPRFSDYGFINDYLIVLDRVDLPGNDPMPNRSAFIGRNSLPTRMWYIDSLGRKVEWNQE